MAGDWIKTRTDLYRDPKVIVMANLLVSRDTESDMSRDCHVTQNVTRCAVVGALVSVWGVSRHQGHRDGDDLILSGVTVPVVDAMADLPGFGRIMQQVGWVVEIDGGVCFPKFFKEHNVDPADQKREKDAERKRRQRERESSGQERDTSRDKSVTVTHREEKRREENTTTNPVVVEIQKSLIRCGVTSAKAAEAAVAAGGPELTLAALEWLEGQRVAGVLPFAPAVIYGRLTQAGRASLPASQGWDDKPSPEYLKAVEKSKQAARKLRESVERIPISELTARHGLWADGLDLSFERVKLERENQVWRMEPDSKVRVELMRRKEMEVRDAKAEAG